MPIRYIEVPAAITLRDPITHEPLKLLDGTEEPPVTWENFISRVMHNPLWGENFRAIKAQHEIITAMSKAKEAGAEMILAEEDWQLFKMAVEFPKPVGYGYNPVLVSQLLPMLTAVMEARASSRLTETPTKPESKKK